MAFSDSEYWRAIPLALAQGYSVDVERGCIKGRSGQLLSIQRYGNQKYPTVHLHVRGLSRPSYVVAAHKVVAFVIWAEAAFADGVHVRHLDGDTLNNRRANLALGNAKTNEQDKCPKVRSRSAAAARAAQGHHSLNALLAPKHIPRILKVLDANRHNGRVRRGVVKKLAARYGVSPSTISLVGKRKSWTAVTR